MSTGNMKALAGAMVEVSFDRLLRIIRNRFEDRLMAEVDMHVPKPPSEVSKRLISGPFPTANPALDDLLNQVHHADVEIEKSPAGN